MRSLAATVSKAKLSGAMSSLMKFLGTAVADALPKSVKSSRRTVTRPEGRYPKSLRSKAREFWKQRAAWGAR